MISPLRLRATRTARERKKVLFVNDCGFLGGAGIGLRRQVQSVLLAGYDASVLCWLEHPADDLRPPRERAFKGEWLGLERRTDLHLGGLSTPRRLADRTAEAILLHDPDVVVFGNLHWAGWPLDLIRAVRDCGVPVVAYMHDLHWVTGRCAYTGGCDRFSSGCDAACPTADEYPPLPPERIAGAWAERREVFTGPRRVPIATNSRWTSAHAERGFGGAADISTLWLGLDTELFRPFDKKTARRVLNLPQDAVIAVCGAVNLAEERKGGPMLRDTVAALAKEGQVTVIGFGHNSEHFPGIHGVGNIVDERQMAVIFNAADFMINAAREEAFGQTLMEASACGLPIVATDVGGVSDVARVDENALLSPYGDTAALLDNIRLLASDTGLRQRMSAAARAIALADFTLDRQAEQWRRLLEDAIAAGKEAPAS